LRSLIFNVVGGIGQATVDALVWLLETFTDIQNKIYNLIVKLVAGGFKGALFVVDRKRVQHLENVMNQSDVINELDILILISKIKEDALMRKSWTPSHSIALNELGSRLYGECEWGKSSVHSYMKAIVESIPGLSYAGDIDDDDDDDDIALDD
jgi:hypothetical protein